jgi:signal transduction histidine kinase
VSSRASDRGRTGGDDMRPVPGRRGHFLEPALAGVGGALCVLAAAITLSGTTAEYAWLAAVARGVVVAAPIAVGLYAWRLPAFRRFGALLVATGFVVFLATLAEASSPELHAVGRIAGWVVEPLLIYLILAFPSGRLDSRLDRALVGSLAVIALTLFLPTALLVERYPEPSTWTSCLGGCPDNPFMITGTEPALVEDVMRPLRELLLILIFAAVTVRIALRFRAASQLMRRMLAPVLGVAAIRLVSFAGLLSLRRVAPESDLVSALIWLQALGIPLLAGAFLVGLARWRLFIAAAGQRLAARLADHPRPEDLRAALAEAFDDPELEIVYRRDGRDGWTDVHGRPVRPPQEGSGRCLSEIRDGDRPIAAIVHDAALRDERGFINAATAYAVMTLDNHRLGTEAAALLTEVQDSRARIQASADEERRRIERDLHDGAQQRLVALRIKLELAAERIDGTDDRSADLIRRLGTELDDALDEVRSLARGIYPSPLADWGLAEGLRSAARHAALPTSVLAAGVRERYPREIESAAYFCCLEAVQNVAKHATGATGAVIELSDNGALRFEVRDDGAGFDERAASTGVGLTSMRDRLAAVGGELAIVSAPGKGTRVFGRIPLAAPVQPSANGSGPQGSALA